MQAGLEAMGLELLVESRHRLAQLTAVAAPDGVKEAEVRRHLLEAHGLEIGGGLGALKGRAWRIGLMGSAATWSNVELCLHALTEGLAAQGFEAPSEGVPVARRIWEEFSDAPV